MKKNKIKCKKTGRTFEMFSSVYEDNYSKSENYEIVKEKRKRKSPKEVKE